MSSVSRMSSRHRMQLRERRVRYPATSPRAHLDQLARHADAAIDSARRRNRYTRPAAPGAAFVRHGPGHVDGDGIDLSVTIALNPYRAAGMSGTGVDAVIERALPDAVEALGVLPHRARGLVARITGDVQKPVRADVLQARIVGRRQRGH